MALCVIKHNLKFFKTREEEKKLLKLLFLKSQSLNARIKDSQKIVWIFFSLRLFMQFKVRIDLNKFCKTLEKNLCNHANMQGLRTIILHI